MSMLYFYLQTAQKFAYIGVYGHRLGTPVALYRANIEVPPGF